MRQVRKLEIIEDKPQVSKPVSSFKKTRLETGFALYLGVHSYADSLRSSPRATEVESLTTISHLRSGSRQNRDFSSKNVLHSEYFTPQQSVENNKLKSITQSLKTHKHAKSEFSTGIFHFLSSNQGFLPSHKAFPEYFNKHSLPGMLSKGTENIISPRFTETTQPTSYKVLTPRATTTRSHSRKNNSDNPGNLESISKKPPPKNEEEPAVFFRPGENGKTALQTRSSKNQRPQTGITIEKKPHTPARMMKINNLTTHRYAAENLDIIEKARERYSTENSPLLEESKNLTLVESLRRNLNRNFMSKFGRYKSQDDKSILKHNNDDLDEELEIIPSLELLNSMKLEDNSPRNSSRNHLSKSRGLTTKRTLKSLKSLNKLDINKGLVKIESGGKRPAVVGLPDKALRIKPNIAELDVKGQGHRGIMKKKTVKIASKAPSSNENEHKDHPIEDHLLNAFLEEKLDAVQLPTKLSALQQFNDAKAISIVKKNARLLQKQQPTFKRIRRKLLETLNEMKRLKLSPKDVKHSLLSANSSTTFALCLILSSPLLIVKKLIIL